MNFIFYVIAECTFTVRYILIVVSASFNTDVSVSKCTLCDTIEDKNENENVGFTLKSCIKLHLYSLNCNKEVWIGLISVL